MSTFIIKMIRWTLKFVQAVGVDMHDLDQWVIYFKEYNENFIGNNTIPPWSNNIERKQRFSAKNYHAKHKITTYVLDKAV